MLLALPTNIRLGWKGTLGFYEHCEITAVKNSVTRQFVEVPTTLLYKVKFHLVIYLAPSTSYKTILCCGKWCVGKMAWHLFLHNFTF